MYRSAAAMTAPPATNFAFRVIVAGSARPEALGACPGQGAWWLRSAWHDSFHRAPRGGRRSVGGKRPFLADEAPPVGEEHRRGEDVGGEDEAPVVRHQAAASASSRSTRTPLARK